MKFTSASRIIYLNGNSNVVSAKVPATINPANSFNKKLTYSSSNVSVATVAADGTVTGKRMGQSTITAKSANGRVASYKLTVKRSSAGLGLHDPSVYRDPLSGNYYTFGSHLVAAKSTNLLGWSWIANSNVAYGETNKLFTKNYKQEFAEAYAFTMPSGANENAWAPDIVYNPTMKKYCMYMTIVDGSKKCSIALATSNSPEGPYAYQGMIVCSGITQDDVSKTNVAKALGITDVQAKESAYANMGTKSPDAIDATTFFDHSGNMWMVYGSFTTAGGIRLLKLDPKTGLRGTNYTDGGTTATALADSDPYYGLKIANNNGEGPFIQEVKDSKSPTGYYYYLWTSVGGLQSYGGYNMRMVRATNVEGPYSDPKGNLATTTASRTETGLRVIDNYKFSHMNVAYTSCGGNSATEDASGKTFIHFHQKFANGTEGFETRTHQTFVNEDGWLVTAPYEYNGETIANSYSNASVVGRYEFIYHRTTYTKTTNTAYDYVASKAINLNTDGTITGAYTGTWKLSGHNVTLEIDGKTYKGVVLEQDEQTDARDKTMVFTAIGSDNRTVWGSKINKTDSEKVTYDATQITVPSSVKEDFTLPTEGLYGASITWKSNSAGIVINGGNATVNRELEDQTATLTATVKSGSSTKALTFKVSVEAITIDIRRAVKTDTIELPAEIDGKAIVWSSNSADINVTTGAVTLPTTGVKTVVLTAKIGNVTKTFDIILLPANVDTYLYEQDYENADSSTWISPNAQASLTIGNESNNKFIQFAPGAANSRGAYTDFTSATGTTGVYIVEMDVNLKAGDGQTTEFALAGTDMAYVSNNINNGIASGYILKLSADMGKTEWTINGINGDAVIEEIPQSWVHVQVIADTNNKVATVIISDDTKEYYIGSVNISGTGALKGLYVRGGRYQSVTKVDNIKVY